jgi:hypothetical protein
MTYKVKRNYLSCIRAAYLLVVIQDHDHVGVKVTRVVHGLIGLACCHLVHRIRKSVKHICEVPFRLLLSLHGSRHHTLYKKQHPPCKSNTQEEELLLKSPAQAKILLPIILRF